MSRPSKVLIGLVATLLTIIVAGALFLRHLVIRSFPVTSGTITLTELHAAVDVYRDGLGVPHIHARDEHDLMVAAGYIHAQDRLWQMDMFRRAGEGRLSEVLGKTTVDFDRLFRTLDLRGVALKIEQNLHPESRRLLESYAAGVNAFINARKRYFPVEFDMLNYEPEPWEVRHSIIVSRLIAWELNLAWWTDLAYGEIASRVPLENLVEIFPTYPDSLALRIPPSELKKSVAGTREFLKIGRLYREYFGLGSLEAGSNGWVVDSSRSMSGMPLLANDPHLALPAPSRWYAIHLTAPGWNVAGVSLPGVPLVVIGRNEHLAWGLTNAMIDDADFYVERLDSSRSDHYLFQNSSLPVIRREETIRIGSSDSVTFIVRATHHGPIINDVHPGSRHADLDSAFHQQPIAMRWTGLDVSDEVYGFFLMNKARDRSEFELGLAEIAVPGQNIVYGDRQGTIAFWMTGRVPIRGKQHAMLPLPGWTGDAEWRGYVPFNRLPRIINPRGGLIVCANQKVGDDSYPYYISTLWEPTSRLLRIRQLLNAPGKFGTDDFQRFQQDQLSLYAEEVTGRLLRSYASVTVDGALVKGALDYLRNWDYRFTDTDIATTIFHTFFVRLVHNIFEDETGSDVLKDFVFFGAIPYRVTSQLLASEESPWFDDVRTPEVESKDDIIQKSLSEAIEELRSRLGPEAKMWQWGNIHTVTFTHIFGRRKPLDKVFNIGPFPIGGGGTTVNKTEFRIGTPYAVAVGASMRQVADLADSTTLHLVITSGQSGQAFHQHYSDQSAHWLNGGYHRLTMDWSTIRNSRWDHLVLQPGGSTE